MRRTHSEGGFSFVELIVALAIMVMIAAVVTPALVGTLDRARVDTSAESLAGLVAGIHAFKTDTDNYPGELSQLGTPIDGTQQNICGTLYPTFPPISNVPSRWNGPYVNPGPPPTGVVMPIGTANNQLERVPTSGNPAVARINVPNVSYEDADALNRSVDGDASGTVGAVRWTGPNANGIVTLHYTTSLNTSNGGC